jgi:hypothetical protein
LQYVLKSSIRLTCSLAAQILRRHNIQSEIEPLIERRRGFGLAVSDDDVFEAKYIVWRDPERLDLWAGPSKVPAPAGAPRSSGEVPGQ